MGALSVFWTFFAFFIVSSQCCELVQNGFFRENGDCAPCQEEKVAYFGNNIKGYSPILQTLSLPQCQINCQNVSECQFWSYEISTQKCYLKTKRNNPTKRVDFISGIKDCSSTNSEIKSEAENSGGQIYVMLNGGQKLSVLPANFGKQFHSGIEFHGTLDRREFNVNNLSRFCELDQLPVGGSEKKSRQIALAERGQCEFAIKAINAQAAGYKALIILDSKNDETDFSRIVSSSANTVPASFIRIPVVLLLKEPAQIAIQTLQETSSNMQEMFIKRFYNNDTYENDQQMAPQSPTIPKIFQKGGLLQWFPYQDMLDYVSKWSPLSLILMGGAILIGFIMVVAFQVCICSKCFKKRRNSRVLPESCTEIPYMTAQLPNAVPYDVSISSASASNNFDHAAPSCGLNNEPFEVSCPVCFEVPLPPRKIFQCSQGHTICDLCLSKIDKKCPTCREDWSNSSNLPVRNRMAESMLNNYFRSDQISIHSSFDNENIGNTSVSTNPYAPSAPPCHPSTSYSSASNY